jgi:hypothetical protein
MRAHGRRTDILADIAPEHPRPNERSVLHRNGASMFDGEVRNALPAIDGIVRAKRSRRTSNNTEPAGTTVSSQRRICFDVEGSDDLAEEDP